MKNKLKNDKGSTLVLLVMAIAIISLLGTSILGVTMMNYKIKKTNTDLKYSFYMSESGLDNAYAESYALMLEALKESNTAAQAKIAEYDLNKLAELIEDGDTHYIEDVDGDGVYSFRQDVIKAEAEGLFESTYINKVKANIATRLLGVNYDDTEEKLTLEITNDNLIAFNADTPLILSISSEYLKKKENIKKTTDVDIEIDVPKYNESYKVSTVNMGINPFWTKALTAENLNIYKESGTVFEGEVFVNNNLNLYNSGKVEFQKDVAVKNNISIYDSKELNTKNVYAKNILLEGANAEFVAEYLGDGNPDTYEGVVVLDDLEMNASGQTVEINGPYYGFGYGGFDRDNTKNSSIIINNANISKLNITGDLYLLGTSYIKGLPYATGESLSILGNYKAYSVPLENGDFREEKVEFKDDYYPFPPLVEWWYNSDNQKNDIQSYQKAEYIKQYNTENSGALKLGNGKVLLNGNVVTLGSVVDDGNIFTSSIGLEEWHDLNENIGDSYYKKINTLGYDAESSTEFSTDEIFDNIGPGDIKTGAPTGTELVYINKVDRSGGDVGPYVLPDGVESGLIITNEDIEISGMVNFTGVIICGGNINIRDDGGDKIFKYNKGIVSSLIAENNLQETIFKNTASVGTVSITTFGEGDSGLSVDFSNLLSFENWKIN